MEKEAAAEEGIYIFQIIIKNERGEIKKKESISSYQSVQ
jgi:hypothetical protein